MKPRFLLPLSELDQFIHPVRGPEAHWGLSIHQTAAEMEGTFASPQAELYRLSNLSAHESG